MASYPLTFALLALLLLLVPTRSAQGQATVLFEGFEGNFPADNGWSVGDADPLGPPAYWDDVDTPFGGVGTHTGLWKGYCAGVGFSGTSATPLYQDSMRSYMRRSIDLTGYAGAELKFWYKIPDMDQYYDALRVYIGGTAVFSRDTVIGSWTEARINLTSFIGVSHILSIEFSSSGGFEQLHKGCYLDDIEVLAFVSPPNDDFANATKLSGGSGSANGFNNAATKATGEPNHAGNSGGHSIWYRWTAPSGTSVNLNTSGSDFDTLLAVYVGGSVDTLVQVAANDDIYGPRNRQSRVRFTPSPGETYWIAVDGYNGGTGSVRLTWQQGGVPDLIIHGPAVLPAVSEYARPDTDCEAIEGLVIGGTRKLVRFTTEARNIGTADLFMGDPAGNPLFTPGKCHPHNHFNGFAAFLVRDGGGNVVANGNKVGFCLEDYSQWNSGANPTAVYHCGYQGIQVGWTDTYTSDVAGQWVDVTGLPAGNYILEQEINPDHILEETDYSNNFTQVPFAIPPYDNDDLVNATRIGTNVSTVTGNNTSATKRNFEPKHGGNAGGKSIWYYWTATSTAGVAFDTIGSSFDTLLSVYTGYAVYALLPVVGNDDINPFNHASRVTFTPVLGTTYLIAVDGFDGASGSVVLNLSPANNAFDDCQVISGVAGTVVGFNLGAGVETGEPNHAGTPGGHSVWYCWTARANDMVEFNTLGSNFDTLLAVYTGGSVNSLTQVAGNDDIDAPLNRQSRVVFYASAGTTYHIAVDGYSGATGTIDLNWSYTCDLTGSNEAGHFLITFQGLPLQTYTIESSDDFAFWIPEANVSTDLFGAGSYDAGSSTDRSWRFYRAFLKP